MIMKTKYGEFPDKMLEHNLNRLTSALYKILCLYEEQSVYLYHYIQSLMYELSGSESIIELFKNNANLIAILSILESISDDVLCGDFDNQKFIKSEVFKCISLVGKLKQVTTESGDD